MTITVVQTATIQYRSSGGSTSGATFTQSPNDWGSGLATHSAVVAVNGAGAAGAQYTGTCTAVASGTSMTVSPTPGTNVSNKGYLVADAGSVSSSNYTTTFSFTPKSNVANGNLMFVGINIDAGLTITSVSDSLNGGTWTAAGAGINQAGVGFQRGFFLQTGSSGATTITVVCSGSTTNAEIFFVEVNSSTGGTWTKDQFATGNSTGTTVVTGSFTTTNANEIIIGWTGVANALNGNATGYTVVPGYNMNNGTSVNTNPSADNAEYKIVTTLQSGVTFSTTQTPSGGFLVTAVTFFVTAAASGLEDGNGPPFQYFIEPQQFVAQAVHEEFVSTVIQAPFEDAGVPPTLPTEPNPPPPLFLFEDFVSTVIQAPFEDAGVPPTTLVEPPPPPPPTASEEFPGGPFPFEEISGIPTNMVEPPPPPPPTLFEDFPGGPFPFQEISGVPTYIVEQQPPPPPPPPYLFEDFPGGPFPFEEISGLPTNMVEPIPPPPQFASEESPAFPFPFEDPGGLPTNIVEPVPPPPPTVSEEFPGGPFPFEEVPFYNVPDADPNPPPPPIIPEEFPGGPFPFEEISGVPTIVVEPPPTATPVSEEFVSATTPAFDEISGIPTIMVEPPPPPPLFIPEDLLTGPPVTIQDEPGAATIAPEDPLPVAPFLSEDMGQTSTTGLDEGGAVATIVVEPALQVALTQEDFAGSLPLEEAPVAAALVSDLNPQASAPPAEEFPGGPFPFEDPGGLPTNLVELPLAQTPIPDEDFPGGPFPFEEISGVPTNLPELPLAQTPVPSEEAMAGPFPFEEVMVPLSRVVDDPVQTIQVAEDFPGVIVLEEGVPLAFTLGDPPQVIIAPIPEEMIPPQSISVDEFGFIPPFVPELQVPVIPPPPEEIVQTSTAIVPEEYPLPPFFQESPLWVGLAVDEGLPVFTPPPPPTPGVNPLLNLGGGEEWPTDPEEYAAYASGFITQEGQYAHFRRGLEQFGGHLPGLATFLDQTAAYLHPRAPVSLEPAQERPTLHGESALALFDAPGAGKKEADYVIAPVGAYGADVRAVAAGRITYVVAANGGLSGIVQGDDGNRYVHVGLRDSVGEPDRWIRAGEIIGTLGTVTSPEVAAAQALAISKLEAKYSYDFSKVLAGSCISLVFLMLGQPEVAVSFIGGVLYAHPTRPASAVRARRRLLPWKKK